MEVIQLLRCTMSWVQAQAIFFKEAASGGADINCNPDFSHTSTKEIPAQQGLSEDWPQRLGTMNTILDHLIGNTVSVIGKDCTSVSHVVNIIKNNAFYFNSHSASVGLAKPFATLATKQQLPSRSSTPSCCKEKTFLFPYPLDMENRLYFLQFDKLKR